MGSRIKSIAKGLIIIAIIGCIICFVIGIIAYSKDSDYIEYATVYGGSSYGSLRNAGDRAYAGKMMMIYGAFGIVGSILGGLPLYWFGCLFECVEEIKYTTGQNKRELEEIKKTLNKNEQI